jgi:hypothetical protein
MNPTKEDLINKWSSILGDTNSHCGNLAQLVESQSNQIVEETKTEEFTSLLPMAMKVSAKTLALDLCFASEEEIDEVKKKVQSENRDGKIDALINNSEFTEKKLEDDHQYKELMKKVTPLSAPVGNLFYLDFKYGHKKTRRSGKKHKKKSNE